MDELHQVKVAVLTVSDRCFAGQAVDKSGPALVEMVHNGKLGSNMSNAKVVWAETVPDEQSMIQKKVRYLCDDMGVSLVITTGGTGLAPRDVTPEALQSLLERQLPALATVILMEGLKSTKFAALSRTVVGVRKKTLVIGLPGSVAGATEGLQAVAPVLHHAIHLIRDQKPEVAAVHRELAQPKVKSKVTVNTDEVTRSRFSPYPMRPMEDVPAILRAEVASLPPKLTPAWEGVGNVLAEDVVAAENIPQLPTSMKDGYAIACEPEGTLPFEVLIVGESTPGKKYLGELKPGQAVKVSTGSAVPEGTGHVIPVEETEVTPTDSTAQVAPSHPTTVSIARLSSMRKPGCDIRAPGSDIRAGQVVLARGTVIGEPELAVLASVGKSRVLLYRKPTVALLSTGDELQDPWSDGPTTGVRDTNKPMLEAMLRGWGYSTIDLGTAHDEPDAVLEAFNRGFSQADFVITTGGVSMGERDLLKQVLLQDLGATIHFGRLAMKPGKPTGFASLEYKGQKKYWVGLPGNPASAFVTGHLALLPALRLASGRTNHVFLNPLRAVLNEDVLRDAERVEYQRGVLSFTDSNSGVLDRPLVRTTGQAAQRSSNVQGCAQANCLLEVPKGEGVLTKGQSVTVFLLK